MSCEEMVMASRTGTPDAERMDKVRAKRAVFDLGATDKLRDALADGVPEEITKAISEWNKSKVTIMESIFTAGVPDNDKMGVEQKKDLVNLYKKVAEGIDNKVISPLLEKNQVLRTELKEQQLKGKVQAMAHLADAQEEIRRFGKK